MTAGMGLYSTDTCSICGATYSGDHCPNCGWFAALLSAVRGAFGSQGGVR